jgi:hypothetical protein
MVLMLRVYGERVGLGLGEGAISVVIATEDAWKRVWRSQHKIDTSGSLFFKHRGYT